MHAAALSSYHLEKMMICQNGPDNSKEPAGRTKILILVLFEISSSDRKRKPSMKNCLNLRSGDSLGNKFSPCLSSAVLCVQGFFNRIFFRICLLSFGHILKPCKQRRCTFHAKPPNPPAVPNRRLRATYADGGNERIPSKHSHL